MLSTGLVLFFLLKKVFFFFVFRLAGFPTFYSSSSSLSSSTFHKIKNWQQTLKEVFKEEDLDLSPVAKDLIHRLNFLFCV